jgi:hypothetical protein
MSVNGKMRPVETIPGMGERGLEEIASLAYSMLLPGHKQKFNKLQKGHGGVWEHSASITEP